MTYYYKVSNKHKKSFIEHQVMTKPLVDDKQQSFIQEEVWRWGELIVKSDLPLEKFKEEIRADEDQGYLSTEDYEVEDYGDFNDGCGTSFYNCVNITDEEVESMYEEDSDWESVHGFSYDDSWIDIHGPIEVEDVTEDYEPKS